MVGNYKWGINARGKLNSFNKFRLSVDALTLRFKRRLFNNNSQLKINVDLDNIRIPDTQLVKQTLEFIDDVHQEYLKNHCLRAYVWGEIFGQSERLKYDKEIFVVSALLHDIGLEEQYCCMHKDIHCFAIEGAKEAGLFRQSLIQLTDKKINIIQDAIALHLNVKIPKLLPEAYLLNKASATDVIGLYLDQIHQETINSVITRYPRLKFKSQIHSLLKAQCKKRPDSRISFLYSNGFGGMIKNSQFKE
ncbi:hypothetical protein JYT44_02615 [Caldithrix abyssi]|nr:hypothetical protein [Caldithrix abyssi]